MRGGGRAPSLEKRVGETQRSSSIGDCDYGFIRANQLQKGEFKKEALLDNELFGVMTSYCDCRLITFLYGLIWRNHLCSEEFI